MSIQFNNIQHPILPKQDNTMQKNAMINDSVIKILNTSITLAPIARNTPISRFFAKIDEEIKLNIIKMRHSRLLCRTDHFKTNYFYIKS